jgi:predicted ArsR family transcriptional regulator
MSNATQTYKLFEVLKSGDPVTVAKIAEELKIKVLSVPVYIHGLKAQKAEIKAIREGRRVVSYQMTNSDSVKISEYRKNSAEASLTTKNAGGVNKLSSQVLEEPSAATLVTDKEMADIRSSLQIDSIDTGRGFGD